jgi:pilus assembly protein Flp/PilA
MLFAPEEKGQGLVEYAIIIALIAIVVITIVGTLGKKVNNIFNSMGNSLTL